MTKIQAEWGKVEALQEEKIKLAERLDRIVSRARERGRAEWKKVGGMDLEEIEKQEGLAMGMSGEMGGNEVLLPPGGLGPGSDSRAHKSRSQRLSPLTIHILILPVWSFQNDDHMHSPCHSLPNPCPPTTLSTHPPHPCHRQLFQPDHPFLHAPPTLIVTPVISPRPLFLKIPTRMARVKWKWQKAIPAIRAMRTIRYIVCVNKRVTAR